jgi:hypothetical protein
VAAGIDDDVLGVGDRPITVELKDIDLLLIEAEVITADKYMQEICTVCCFWLQMIAYKLHDCCTRSCSCAHQAVCRCFYFCTGCCSLALLSAC